MSGIDYHISLYIYIILLYKYPIYNQAIDKKARNQTWSKAERAAVRYMENKLMPVRLERIRAGLQSKINQGYTLVINPPHDPEHEVTKSNLESCMQYECEEQMFDLHGMTSDDELPTNQEILISTEHEQQTYIPEPQLLEPRFEYTFGYKGQGYQEMITYDSVDKEVSAP